MMQDKSYQKLWFLLCKKELFLRVTVASDQFPLLKFMTITVKVKKWFVDSEHVPNYKSDDKYATSYNFMYGSE